MDLKAYVEQKYGGKIQALNGAEARAFGVPYPLKSGWLVAYGDVELTDARREILMSALQKKALSVKSGRHRKGRKLAAKYARVGMEVLQAVPDPADEFRRRFA